MITFSDSKDPIWNSRDPNRVSKTPYQIPGLNYYSGNSVLFNFRGDNARVFQRVSMNLNMTVGQAACQLLGRYTQSTLAASCVYERLYCVLCNVFTPTRKTQDF